MCGQGLVVEVHQLGTSVHGLVCLQQFFGGFIFVELLSSPKPFASWFYEAEILKKNLVSKVSDLESWFLVGFRKIWWMNLCPLAYPRVGNKKNTKNGSLKICQSEMAGLIGAAGSQQQLGWGVPRPTGIQRTSTLVCQSGKRCHTRFGRQTIWSRKDI